MQTMYLSEMLHVISGFPVRKKTRAGGRGLDIKHVSMKDINHEQYTIHHEQLGLENVYMKKDDQVLRENDLLFLALGTKNTTIKITASDITDGVLVPGTHFFIMRLQAPQQATIDLDYFCWYMNTIALSYFAKHRKGVTTKNVSSDILKNTPIKLPKLETQKLIAQSHQLLLKEEMLMKELMDTRKKMLEQMLNEL